MAEAGAQTVTPKDAAPADRVRIGLETYFDFVEQHEPAYLALMRGGIGSDPEVFVILASARATFMERIVEALPAPASPLLRALLRGWVGFVEATSTEWLARKEVTRDELVSKIGAVLAPCVALAAASP